ncbi:MAG: tetratricopeptide repeat protein [Spirochaetaceae bacterium]|jgi:tetratricopeptide (TPR) repeat protein|nr:tetratricopeptide repeat protein [Spirochaetaceae bacterium]
MQQKNDALRTALFCAVMAAAVAGCASSPERAASYTDRNSSKSTPRYADVKSPEPVEADAEEGLSLEKGIAQIARALEAELPEKTSIAVVNFESPSARFSDYLLEELQAILVNNKRLVVVDRSNLEQRRDELNFQMSGEVSDESAISIGHWLGAQVIVTGGLTDLGTGYRCRFNAIDVKEAVRLVSPGVIIRKNDKTIAYMLPKETLAALPERVPAKPDPALATQYFNAGVAHYEAGRYAQAAADFTRALEIEADDEASLRYRAYAYNYLKDYDKALADASRLLQLKPDNVERYRTRGLAYADKGDYDRAIADYTEALRLKPDYALAYNNRGNAYAMKGDYDRAIADYNQAIRLNPALAQAYNNRGIAYKNKRDYDRAIADYTKAISLKPDYAAAYNNRGHAYADKRDYDRAIADYNQAIRLDPSDAYAYISRGYAYAMKENYARARADFEKALQLDPSNTTARNNLEALRDMGY